MPKEYNSPSSYAQKEVKEDQQRRDSDSNETRKEKIETLAVKAKKTYKKVANRIKPVAMTLPEEF